MELENVHIVNFVSMTGQRLECRFRTRGAAIKVLDEFVSKQIEISSQDKLTYSEPITFEAINGRWVIQAAAYAAVTLYTVAQSIESGIWSELYRQRTEETIKAVSGATPGLVPKRSSK